MNRARVLLLALAALSLTAGSCGGGGSASSGSAEHEPHQANCHPQGEAITLVAHNTRLDPTCLAAAAGKGLEVRFDNQDGGARHNFSVYSADPAVDSNAKALFRGMIVQGPAMITYEVPPLAAGTYHFQCDVHPVQMRGVFVAE